MAEAAVERSPARFYCHICDVEFQSVGYNFTCPHCCNGFIEELQDNVEQSSPARTLLRTIDQQDFTPMDETTSFILNDQIPGGRNENGGIPDGRAFLRPAPSNLRHPLPIEHLVHDFIINLGVGVNWGGQGNLQFFLGNPGDYAWGREGLDAIVTQLLNQMESTGPPPLSKAVIDALQVVEVTEEQVGQNMQCSVCWEHFQLKEEVRQLPCLHIYHENCIRPWLELHGTCPICRQNLGANGQATGHNGSEDNLEVTGAPDLFRTLFGRTSPPPTTPSSSNQANQSGSSGGRTRSNNDTTF